jgi:FixJ family two-component response regulator
MKTMRKTVAVIENDAAMLKSLERLLRAYGYSSELYTSAEMFLNRVPESEVGCLILDIDLDGISGFELQTRLALNGKVPPTIFITGQSDERYRKQALKIGCIDYLNKPFESHMLIRALVRATNGV